MENSDVFKDNRFINRALKLYIELQTNETYYNEENKRVETDYHVIGNLFRKKIEYEKHEIHILDIYARHARSLSIKPLIFSNMWEFCQFVRWAEKVVFYRNEAENKLYVDSAIDDLDCRLLVFHNDSINIRFKLEKVANPAYIPNTLSDILSMNSDTPKYFKSMKIVVERTYGKGMTNHFTIIDDNTDFKDQSDTMLLESIESILKYEHEAVIYQVFNLMYARYKVDL